MNSGKNNGGKSPAPAPAPLPVHPPVALKHVPTMVVSRYDPDLRRPTSDDSDGRKTISEAESINDDTLVSLGTESDNDQGKNNGGKFPTPRPPPAPSPMYPPVALKHVPTIVTSRYDPDIRRPTSGLASEYLKDRENKGKKVNHMDTNVDDDTKNDRQRNVFSLKTLLQRLGVHSTSTHTRLDKALVWIRKRNYGNKLLTAAVIATVFYLWRNKKYR